MYVSLLTTGLKDTDGTSQESWANKASPEYVVNFLKENFPDVPEYLYKLIRTAPEDGIIDWALLWRDPQPNWTSPLGRVVQVGDSAHTFLPSSGNGAVQGIEDAISVATCLQLGGVKNGLWSKTHNKLRQVGFSSHVASYLCHDPTNRHRRFERVSCCQLVGFLNQTNFLKPALRKVGGASATPKPEYGRWIWAHNPERYAYDNYGKALKSLVDGSPFQNTNIPPGYNYKPWSLHELYGRIDKGEKVQFEGDWS